MHILRQNYFVNFVLLLSSIYCYYELSIKIIQNHSRLNTKFPLKIKKKPKKWLNARICVLSERKKKQSLFFANHFISLKAGKSDYLSPPPVKIQLFPPRFLEKRKKRERGRKEKKRMKYFHTLHNRVEPLNQRCHAQHVFPIATRAWSTAFVRPRNFSVSFGLPPNECILCQLNSLLRHAGNCLAGNGRRVTTIVLRHGHPENRFNWFRGTAGN